MAVQQESTARAALLEEYVEGTNREQRARTGQLRFELFAFGLHNPSHMEWTSDHRLLVSDLSAGKVFDVTDGGDMSEATPFATGLRGPAAIVPLDDRILVAEAFAGRVSDISSGARHTFASGLRFPYSMVSLALGGHRRTLVSEVVSPFRGQYLDITKGGERADFEVFISEIPRQRKNIFTGKYPGTYVLSGEGYPVAKTDDSGVASGLIMAPCDSWATPVEFDDGAVALGMKVSSLGAFIRVPDAGGSAFDMLEDQSNVLASGLDPVAAGCIQHPTNRKIYIAQPLTGEVRAFDPNHPAYLAFEPPVVSGLNGPTCVRFSADGEFMYACAQSDGVVWRISNFR